MTIRWRPLLAAIVACAIASPALLAKPGPGHERWARFDDAASLATARPIVASEVRGDAGLSDLSLDDGMLVVKGTLGLDNGSRWSTLGAEIAPTNVETGADLNAASVLRIRLASAVARPLRVRIKGGDREIGNAGCYPIVVQMVATVPADYVIPLSAFHSPGWCGAKTVSIEETLRTARRVEVTANDEPAGAVSFSVGRIDFLADDWNEQGRNGRLAWSDDFEGARAPAAARAGWQAASGSDRGVALDGHGRLQLRVPPGHDAAAARVSIRSSAAHPSTHGRTEVRLQVPEAADGARAPGIRVALQAPAPGSAAIVLFEGSANAEGFAAGLDGPGPESPALRMRTAVPSPLKDHVVTIASDRDLDSIRWLVDGILVQELARTDLPPSVWSALEQAPLALEISVDGTDGSVAADGSAALLVESVRFWQREDASAAVASVTPAASRTAANASTPASAAASRRKPVAGGPPASAPAAASSKRVVCEYSTRYQLMLCY